MSASLPRATRVSSCASWPQAASSSLHFGTRRCDAGVEWLLRRNCSISPAQLLKAYGALCLISLTVASFFWWQGATMVMPFAWCELLAVGTAMLVFARHAGDRECIAWQDGRLTVEQFEGTRVRRVELAGDWVRVEPLGPGRSLIALTSGRQRVAIGRHVRPEWRPLLADELRSVLRSRTVDASRDDQAAQARQSDPNLKL